MQNFNYWFVFVAGSQQVSAVVAFTLAMFSQLVQQVIHHIQDSVFNMSFPTFATPPIPTPTSLPRPADDKASDTTTPTFFASDNALQESNFSIVSSSADSNKITVNSSQKILDKSCNSEGTVAVVNGNSSQAENAQELKTAAKKKKYKSLHKLRRRRRRRRRRKNSSEESDLSDGKILIFLFYSNCV